MQYNLRKCVGCGEMKPRKDLIKIIKDSFTDKVVINPNSKTFGRSAYLCYNQNCIELALKKNKLNKTLKTGAEIIKEDLLELLQV